METLLLCLLWAVQGEVQAPARDFELEDVAFIAGVWQNEQDGVHIEEVWSEPNGDSMMGMFRFVQDGKGVFYEMMIIEKTDEGVVLRLKHFNAGLIGWEEKADVHNFFLEEASATEAVFVKRDTPQRLRYTLGGDQELVVRLEELKEGEWSAETFAFKRRH